jgi:hypothetical protein
MLRHKWGGWRFCRVTPSEEIERYGIERPWVCVPFGVDLLAETDRIMRPWAHEPGIPWPAPNLFPTMDRWAAKIHEIRWRISTAYDVLRGDSDIHGMDRW